MDRNGWILGRYWNERWMEGRMELRNMDRQIEGFTKSGWIGIGGRKGRGPVERWIEGE